MNFEIPKRHPFAVPESMVLPPNTAVPLTVHHPDYEHVNHPKHYNTHPSGVECVDIAELMLFNVGNAFKYVYRRGDKGKARQDIDKALWYLRRELDRLSLFVLKNPAHVVDCMYANDTFSEEVWALSYRVIALEPHPLVADFYSAIFDDCSISNYINSLEEAISLLERLKQET
ncbi:hypothetical protein BcepSauron_185 [Burkholderia phage BcepSauron]|uniref:DUF3310 domain-containing protein n=1 Tax=Burkholderia phage BcepSauron TaxID=2530033 RepID=A0A482MLQ0_9CAUD|nr:nucleotide kinase [Burkholderia phage BcepSauron]QBQ74565.1 hypothetical protein BcepSauron_185 [Burkholderia phage BcepSauron]